MDGDPVRERLVGPERLVEHAVADLLERPGGVPRLDDRGPVARPDDVDGEEVVVDDEDPRGRQVIGGHDGLPRRPDPPACASGRAMGDGHDRDLGVARREVVRDRCQVAGQHRRVRRGQHDPPPERQVPRIRERDADEDDADGQDDAAHRTGTAGPRMSWSITRSVEPASRWAKWRLAKSATFSAW